MSNQRAFICLSFHHPCFALEAANHGNFPFPHGINPDSSNLGSPAQAVAVRICGNILGLPVYWVAGTMFDGNLEFLNVCTKSI